MTRTTLAMLVLAVALCAAAGASVSEATMQPLAVVVRHGGLCMAGRECETVFRITDATISGDGFRSRPLKPAERRRLIRAIGALKVSYVRRHPFTGMCPMALDGQESIYRFRGFAIAVPSCKYDVRGIAAVRLTERLVSTLKPR